ncbi:hypothetical protein ILUMI_22393 [Ignelater luminosus]|uniref:B30.2/SPRY domain-containing protein n=1 Tax=Ignelater luminosus TaxID=2038154 RepID=A0A8K0CGV8_IGNLU|nr:hypothetical protein ILUMI_22393 [Ignelater luminosus]
MTAESKQIKGLLKKLLPPVDSQLINYSWNKDDAGPNLFVNSRDAFIVYKYAEDEPSTDCIRGKTGFNNGIHAWEITWRMLDRGPFPIVGVATRESPLFEEGEKMVLGNSNQSWGWDLSTCRLYHNSADGTGKLYPESLPQGMTMTVGEKVTLLLDMAEGTLSYISDDTYLGVAFNNLKGLKLYPIVNITKQGAQVDMKYLGGLATKSQAKK